MTARILKARSSLSIILSEIRYTLSRLSASPAAAAHVATFTALRSEWTVVQNQEIALQEELYHAQVLVDAADEGLDEFAGRFSRAILNIVEDRNSPLYTHYFGKRTLAEFRRPTLGAELAAMKDWIPSLDGSPHASLKAMQPELVSLVAAADAAETARSDAKQKIRQFREVGERRQFIDKLNAARKSVHGALATLPFGNPSLPHDFADRFFRTESAGDEVEEPTIASVEAEIAELEALLALKREWLAAQKAAADAAAKAAAEQEARATALAEVEKQMAELAKKAAELKTPK